MNLPELELLYVMENFFGETIDIYKNKTKRNFVVLFYDRQKEFQDEMEAYNYAYKRGYRE